VNTQGTFLHHGVQHWVNIERIFSEHWLTIELPLSHHWVTIKSPLNHHWVTIKSPLNHHWVTIESPFSVGRWSLSTAMSRGWARGCAWPLWDYCMTIEWPLSEYWVTIESSLSHQWPRGTSSPCRPAWRPSPLTTHPRVIFWPLRDHNRVGRSSPPTTMSRGWPVGCAWTLARPSPACARMTSCSTPRWGGDPPNIACGWCLF
jgi:hypothetical protein